MIIDIIAALLLAYGFYTGYSKGIIKTVFNTLSIFIGILGAFKLSPIVTGVLEKLVTPSTIVSIVGLVLTFIIVLAIIRFVGEKLESLFKTVHINFINKILGGALMSIFYLVIFSYTIWGLSSLRVLNENTSRNSISYTLIKPIPQATKQVFIKAKPFFKEFWDRVIVVVDNIKDEGEELQNNENHEN